MALQARRSDEMDTVLSALYLTRNEAAALLGVDYRTIQRWASLGMPSTARCALSAWLELRRRGEIWRPGSIPMTTFADIKAIIAGVAKRGGPASPWSVDLEREDAALGPVLMTFRCGQHHAHGFALVSYERSDATPDLARDRVIIEDGIFRIDAAVRARGKR